jgi:hypothetical protein
LVQSVVSPNNKTIAFGKKPQRERPRKNEFMPFVSRAQQRWGHTEAGEKALGGPAAVAEWDSATPKGKGVPQRKLPKRINKMKARGRISDKQHSKLADKWGKDDDGINASSR